MTIKMKVGLSGADFSVSSGDITDRFSEAEEGRMIEAGFAVAAEAVAPDVVEPAAAPARKPRKAN